jgi:hypothetical protein
VLVQRETGGNLAELLLSIAALVRDRQKLAGTVRVLSAEERGMPQRIVVYDGPGSPETAVLCYRARMRTLGWQEDDVLAKMAERQGKHALKFGSPDGHEVVLDLSSATDGQGLTICAIQTR